MSSDRDSPIPLKAASQRDESVRDQDKTNRLERTKNKKKGSSVFSVTGLGRCNFRKDPLRSWLQLVGSLTRPLSPKPFAVFHRIPPRPLSLPRAILLADLIHLFPRHPRRNVRQRGGRGWAFSRAPTRGRVIGRAISSFIKRIVRPLGVARHAGVGGECRKGTLEGVGRGRVVTPTK